MQRIATRIRTGVVLAAAVLTVLGWVAPAATADPGPTAQAVFNKPGPHPVATAVRTNPCQESVYGMFQHIVVHMLGNRDDMTCTQAFPNGLESPIGVNTYYPADIADLPNAPLLVFTSGFDANPGMYDALAQQWASHGFVVVIPYEFFNSLVYVPALGVASAVVADRDPNSPLYQKVDLSRTIFAGHSGGGQAALQAGTVFPGIAAAIDPAMRVRGVLAVQPGPLAVGALVSVPTLFLTGYNDFVVPDFAWVRWWQYNLTYNAPAWIANARGVSHFSPVDGLDNYLSAGTAVAWLRYLAFGDETAAQYFVGPDWRLPADKTYFSVERNALANAVQ
ncbi:poly(ethylene terephthalate) hydrolase family protein [Nocardia brasiliensis]|uniref:poly(ethylene terephthalate) hydrolase family protein n=1 Tax=Nocardia brasiliensis TaxID=37326 RepID=UPI000AA81891|nr:alpha/beta hydrolase [Nocardia brasiliensis]